MKPKGMPSRKVEHFVLYILKKTYTKINAAATQTNSNVSMIGLKDVPTYLCIFILKF